MGCSSSKLCDCVQATKHEDVICHDDSRSVAVPACDLDMKALPYENFPSITTEESHDQASFICYYTGIDGSRDYERIGWHTASKLTRYPPTDLLKGLETRSSNSFGVHETYLRCFHPKESWSFQCDRCISWCTVRKDEHGTLWVTGHRLATEILRRLYKSCSLHKALPLINDFAKSVGNGSLFYLDGSSAMEVWKHLRDQSWWTESAEKTMKNIMVYVAKKLERLEAGSYFPRDTLLYSEAAKDLTKWPYCNGGTEPNWAWQLKRRCFLLPWGPKGLKDTFEP